MIRDLQKADMWKRISAFIFDKILLFTLAVGFAFLLSFIFDFQPYTDLYVSRQQAIGEQYNVNLDITEEDYNKLTTEERAKIDEAIVAFNNDKDAQYAMSVIFQLTLSLVIFSLLLAYVALDFVVPLLFGNGQTFGKKIFAIGVMRIDGVRITPMLLFVRTLLGKYTVETMIPIIILIGLFFGITGIVGTAVLLLIFITYIVLLIKTPTRSAIHDMLAQTVCIDMTSQAIFDTEEQMNEYKLNLHKEMAENADY